jgi:hypothetical protein
MPSIMALSRGRDIGWHFKALDLATFRNKNTQLLFTEPRRSTLGCKQSLLGQIIRQTKLSLASRPLG